MRTFGQWLQEHIQAQAEPDGRLMDSAVRLASEAWKAAQEEQRARDSEVAQRYDDGHGNVHTASNIAHRIRTEDA